MELLKKFFPFSFRTKDNDVGSLVWLIILHVAVGIVAGVVFGLLGGIPLLGLPFRIVGYLVDLYITGGIVIAILQYVKVIR